MIKEADFKNALLALKDLLVAARTMAFEKRSHEQLAAYLDAIEYLPTLIAQDADLTADYRSVLEDLAARFPVARVALQRFDRQIPQ